MATKKKSSSTDQKLGWHFLPKDMKLSYSDGRSVKVGQTLVMKGSEKPQCCHTGMHASEKPSQAATYNRGPVLSRVLVTGDIDVDSDKFAGRARTVIWAKELKEQDLKDILDTVKFSYYSTGQDQLVGYLGSAARSYPKEIDKALTEWAKKNGWKSDALANVQTVKLVYEKKQVDEDEVLKFLSPRQVRTLREIEADMKGCYDVNDDSGDGMTLCDALDEAVYAGNACRVEGYDKNGDDGFVLKLKRK